VSWLHFRLSFYFDYSYYSRLRGGGAKCTPLARHLLTAAAVARRTWCFFLFNSHSVERAAAPHILPPRVAPLFLHNGRMFFLCIFLFFFFLFFCYCFYYNVDIEWPVVLFF
jgi:hypothetical protein